MHNSINEIGFIGKLVNFMGKTTVKWKLPLIQHSYMTCLKELTLAT